MAALALITQLAFAAAPGTPSPEPNESDLTRHDHYVNKSGQEVHSPSASVSGKVPARASAKCRDGTYSFSTHHSGTCSRHGGVAEWE
ncbi:MAG: DUF3761 domain-containing protein [Pararobbsia sp.]